MIVVGYLIQDYFLEPVWGRRGSLQDLALIPLAISEGSCGFLSNVDAIPPRFNLDYVRTWEGEN